jgi:hypothetical protein
VLLVVEQGAAEGALSPFAARDLELLWCELGSPLGVSLDDRRHLNRADQFAGAVEDFDFHGWFLVAGSDFEYFIPGTLENETTKSSIAAMTRRMLLTMLIVLPIAALTALVGRRAPMAVRAQDAAQLKQPSKAQRHPPLQGTQSCATSVCHGGGDLGKRLSEYTTWLSLDPHAHAYESLLNEKSQAIAKNLWAGKTVAHESALCLKCHVDPNYEHARPNFRRQDGVGCESCHGAAQDWLHDHYRNGGHRDGMIDTRILPTRAGVCVGCHVGTPGNDVDHDLIAAGHPALRFEFATYFANLLPHWDVAKDKEKPDFEARAWIAGQLVSAGQAMELRAHRADPENKRPWPEFAEFDCFACHHDLQPSSWRQSRPHLENRRPGSLHLSDWYTALLPELFVAAKVENADPLGSAMRPRQETTANAKALAQSLAKLATKSPDANWLEPLRRRRSDRSWEQATQHYLALLALQQMDKDNRRPADSALNDLIDDLRLKVTFARGYDSPRRFVPGRVP